MSYFEEPHGLEDDTKIGGSDNGSDSDSSDNNSDSEAEQEEEGVEDLIKTVEEEEDLEEAGEEDEEEDEDEEDDDDEQSGGAPEDDLEEGEIGEEEAAEIKAKKIKKIPAKTIYKKPEFTEDDEADEDDDDDGELYLQKFDRAINDNYIVNNHPESVLQNYDEILVMIKVVRDKDGIIIDDLHRTIPYLTKYEKARILGQRAKQINSGSKPFIKVHEDILDGYIIAELELKAKSIPFIIRRPLPNGGSEYWSIKDLEDISF
jgi:DNA-directed RNA polymerase subunit K/omega